MKIEQIKLQILPVLQKHSVKKAGIFGSYVKGTFTDQSDVDILIELPKTISLLDFVGIKLELEDILLKKVDLVEYQAIKPALKKQILNEAIAIL